MNKVVDRRFGPKVTERPGDSESSHDILATFAADGILWFSGCGFDRTEFEEMTDRLGPVNAMNTSDAYGGVAALGLHSEMAWLPDPPDAIAFWCATPAAEGGETIACDGVELWRGLSDDARSFFTRHRLLFQLAWQPERWRWIFGVETPEEALAVYHETPGVDAWMDGDLYHYRYLAPAVRPTRWGGAEAFANSVMHSLAGAQAYDPVTGRGHAIPEELIAEVRETAEQLTVAISWERGDILWLDNTRVMHGRRHYEDQRRDIKVRCIPRFGPWAAQQPTTTS